MNDLISRQAAIDTLNDGAELLNRVLDDADIVGSAREKYEWGLGLIESYISDMKELPSAEPRWIPVSERLPEEEDYHDFWEFPDGAVLWCKDTGEIGIGWYYKLSNNWGDLWDNAVRDIVAWMPLPEPYKGGAE